jgi:hypothetical protein
MLCYNQRQWRIYIIMTFVHHFFIMCDVLLTKVFGKSILETWYLFRNLTETICQYLLLNLLYFYIKLFDSLIYATCLFRFSICCLLICLFIYGKKQGFEDTERVTRGTDTIMAKRKKGRKNKDAQNITEN